MTATEKAGLSLSIVASSLWSATLVLDIEWLSWVAIGLAMAGYFIFLFAGKREEES